MSVNSSADPIPSTSNVTGSPAASVWQSLLSAQLLFALVMALAYPLFAWLGYRQVGTYGIRLASMAGLVCWFAGAIAVASIVATRNSNGVVGSVLLGTLVRLGFPLAAMYYASAVMQGPEGRCLGGLLVGYYLVGLVVETPLLLKYSKVNRVTLKNGV